MAEKRRVGFCAAPGLGSDAIGDTTDWFEDGRAVVGRPPGVRARFRVMPIAPDRERVSADWE
jgi:hypothetical protein